MKHLIFLGLTTLVFSAHAGDYYEKNGLALGGFDPVSYFSTEGPKLGDPAITTEVEGSTFTFKSATNKKVFLANPSRYLPQFNGFCAFGTAGGYKAKTEPDAYSIVNGKLYLNYDIRVREKWNSDRQNYIKKAEENWPKVKSTQKIYQ